MPHSLALPPNPVSYARPLSTNLQHQAGATLFTELKCLASQQTEGEGPTSVTTLIAN